MYQAIDKMPYLLETLEKTESQHKSLLMELFTNPLKVCCIIMLMAEQFSTTYTKNKTEMQKMRRGIVLNVWRKQRR